MRQSSELTLSDWHKVLNCSKQVSCETRSKQGNNLDSKMTSAVCSDGFFVNFKKIPLPGLLIWIWISK